MAATRAVTLRDLEPVRERAALVDGERDAERADQIARVVAEYKSSEEYKRDSVAQLRPDIEESLTQIHDYRSLISQIIQNVNVLLQEEMPDVEIDEQLKQTSPQLQSIYWAARLMEFKLKGPLFLINPEIITASSEKRIFRLHGAVKKYVAMYAAHATSRNVDLTLAGYSYGTLYGNPDAFGVIYHAFIDNALKYAPSNSEIIVKLEESAASISLEVRSVGPRIDPAERDSIFDLYYRGKHAKKQKFEGTGFGLGMARYISSYIGAKLSVWQADATTDQDGNYETVFTVEFPRPGPEDRPTSLERARTRTRGGKSTLI